MPEYTIKFRVDIIVTGDMTVQADSEEAAEDYASDIVRKFHINSPITWQEFNYADYNIEWEEDSIDIDIVEIS